MTSGTTALKDQREHQPLGIDLRLISIALLVLLLSGCGYSFSGMSKSAYPTIQSVFVDTFTNRTSEANLDIILRTDFSNEIVQNGHFKLVSSRGEADAILRGTLLSMQVSPSPTRRAASLPRTGSPSYWSFSSRKGRVAGLSGRTDPLSGRGIIASLQSGRRRPIAKIPSSSWQAIQPRRYTD